MSLWVAKKGRGLVCTCRCLGDVGVFEYIRRLAYLVALPSHHARSTYEVLR